MNLACNGMSSKTRRQLQRYNCDSLPMIFASGSHGHHTTMHVCRRCICYCQAGPQRLVECQSNSMELSMLQYVKQNVAGTYVCTAAVKDNSPPQS